MIKRIKATGHTAHFIEEIWCVMENRLTKKQQQDIIIPSGYLHLVYNLGEPYYRYVDEAMVEVMNVCLVAQLTEPVQIQYSHSVHQIGLALKPLGLLALTDIRAGELDKLVQDARQIEGLKGWRPLIEVCEDRRERSPDQLLETLYQSIEDLLMNQPWSHPEWVKIEMLIHKLEDANGVMNMEELARWAGYSLNGLERKFKRYVGLRPKQYAEIVKLRQAFTQEAALDYYYDQSHYIRRMKKHTSKSPSAIEKATEITLKQMLDDQ